MNKVAVIGTGCSGSRYCDALEYCPEKAFRFRGKWVISLTACKAEEGCRTCIDHCRHDAISIEEGSSPGKDWLNKTYKPTSQSSKTTLPSGGSVVKKEEQVTFIPPKVSETQKLFDGMVKKNEEEYQQARREMESKTKKVTGKVLNEWSDHGAIRALILRQDGVIALCTWVEGEDYWSYDRHADASLINQMTLSIELCLVNQMTSSIEPCLILGCSNEADPNLFLPLRDGKPDLLKKGFQGKVCKQCFSKHVERTTKRDTSTPITEIQVSIDNKPIPPYKYNSKEGFYHITVIDSDGIAETSFVNHLKEPIYVSGNIQINYTYISMQYTRVKTVLNGYLTVLMGIVRPLLLLILPQKKKKSSKKEQRR